MLRVLGQGGMGRVYLARGRGARLYAVKVIRPHLAGEDGFRARFVREASAARAVSGAFTAPVVEVSASDAELRWMVTAFVAAPPLDVLIGRSGVLPPAGVWWVTAGIAEALLSIHGVGLVHRDLKPANVLLTADGPRVIDFGIAKALDTTGTASMYVVGTPGFMAPEHIRGAAEPLSDVFALGAVMVFAATGHAPFQGPSAGDVLAQTLYQPPDLNGLPAELSDVVTRCLAKTAAERPTVNEILEEFAHHRDRTLDPHTATSWLPATALGVIEDFGRGQASVAPTAPLPPPAQTRLIEEDIAHRARQADALREAGDAAGARDLYLDVVAGLTRVLGPDDLDTLRARGHHAFVVGRAGDPAGARDLLADLAADETRVLGPDHPHTLNSRHLHAYYAGMAGDVARAQILHTDLVADMMRVLGPDHRSTKSAQTWLRQFRAGLQSAPNG